MGGESIPKNGLLNCQDTPIDFTMAAENPFKSILTSLQKPDDGEFGKYYSWPALNDPRVGWTNVLPLRKKRQAFNRCYELVVQQLGPRQANAPTTAAPPFGSLPSLAPPLPQIA